MGVSDWFRSRRRHEQDRRATGELLDDHHDRASATGAGDEFLVAPHKVLANIDLAIERLDLDISAHVAIEDFASPEELMVIVDRLGMGSMLLAHTANTAVRIMLARYPHELVRNAIPPEVDVRTMVPITGTDREHDLARRVLNRRAGSEVELDESTPLPELADGYEPPEVLTAFVLLYALYGVKLNALKQRTGIE